jgi:large subunit ribosomal protein L17
MRKQVFGRKLQRDINERKALFKSLMTSLIEKESIKTTEAKAKAVKGEMEKLVTKARDEGKAAERALQAYFSAPVMRKLINEVAPRFVGRPGGYTRIIKIGNRLRDNAAMVVLEWVEKASSKSSKAKIIKLEDKAEVVEAEVVTNAPEKEVKKVTKKVEKKETKEKKK